MEEKKTVESEEKKGLSFVEQIIEDDLAKGKNGGRIQTRFPPEPNSFYIESLAAEGTITKTVNVTVKPTAAAQSHSMTLDFTYDYMDGSTRRNAKTTETISMPVLQVDRFTVTGIDLSPQIFIGEETGLSVNFVNKSRTEIYNLSAKLS